METKEINIQSLLKRRRLSGDEAGRAIIFGLFDYIQNRNKPGFEVLDQKKINALEARLPYGAKDRYNFYVKAFFCFQTLYFDEAKKMELNFELGYGLIGSSLTMLNISERVLRSIQTRMPLLLTQEEYTLYKAQAKAARTAKKESIASILFTEIADRLKAPKGDYIDDLIADTKRKPATNPRILREYNQNHGAGAYLFDEETAEEWEYYRQHPEEPASKAAAERQEKRIKDLTGKFHAETEAAGQMNAAEVGNIAALEVLSIPDAEKTVNRLFFEGKAALKKFYAEATGEAMQPADEPAYMAALQALADPDKEPEPEIKPYFVKLQGLIAGVSVRYEYFKQPPTLTQYDLLKDCEQAYSGHFSEFKKDFATVYGALITNLTDEIPKLRGAEPTRKLISRGELAKHFEEWNERLEPTEAEIITAYEGTRLGKNGIAIVHGTDEIFDYPYTPPPKMDDLSFRPEYWIEPTIRFYNAYNAFAEIFAKRYKIPLEVDIFDTVQSEKSLQNANNLLYAAYANVYGTDGEKRQKRQRLKKLFKPMQGKQYAVTRAKITEAKGMFDALEVTYEQDYTLWRNENDRLIGLFREIFNALL